MARASCAIEDPAVRTVTLRADPGDCVGELLRSFDVVARLVGNT